MNLRGIAFLILTVTPFGASAEPDRWSILLGSEHVGAEEFNEVNPGLFATWERDPFHWTLGAYWNSYERGSIAATGYFPIVRWGEGDGGLFAGIAYYPEDGRRFAAHIGSDVVFLGGIQARHRNLFIQAIPMDGKPVNLLLSFGVTWRPL